MSFGRSLNFSDIKRGWRSSASVTSLDLLSSGGLTVLSVIGCRSSKYVADMFCSSNASSSVKHIPKAAKVRSVQFLLITASSYAIQVTIEI